jgi:hypothetical protein
LKIYIGKVYFDICKIVKIIIKFPNFGNWKIMRNITIIYEILFLDLEMWKMLFGKYGGILRSKIVFEKGCEMFIKLLSQFLKNIA